MPEERHHEDEPTNVMLGGEPTPGAMPIQPGAADQRSKPPAPAASNGTPPEGGVDDRDQPVKWSVRGKAGSITKELREALTRQLIAMSLLILMAILIIGHYACVAFLDDKSKLEQLSSIFREVLPMISGLFGSAVTYYFTQNKNGATGDDGTSK